MINLRKRGNKYYLWGEYLGVKVQKATKTECQVTAESMRLDKVVEIERENPTLANAWHMQKQMRKAKEEAGEVEAPVTEYKVGDWENFNVEIVEYYPCKNEKELKQREQYYIKKYEPTLNSFNAYTTQEEKKEKKKI